MARTDWKYDDVVTEKDLNQIGQEINEKETSTGAQNKANIAEQNSKAYTDQQITLVTETGIPKLNLYEYKFNNVAIGTTEIEIPLETFDKQTDTVKVYINTVPRDTDYFTVGTNKIILHDSLTVESKVTIEIWKNIPIGEEGSVSGQVIAIDSLPVDRVQGLGEVLDNKVNKSGDNMAGELTIKSNKVWHAGNDGHLSGLDADLLDGREGSYYMNAIHTGSPDADPNETTVGMMVTNHLNVPTGTGYWYIVTNFLNNTTNGASKQQTAYQYYQGSRMYVRNKYQGDAWSPWIQVFTSEEGVNAIAPLGTATDPNTTTTPLILSNHANVPTGSGIWYISTSWYSNRTNPRSQIAHGYDSVTPQMYIRSFSSNQWRPWVKVLTESDQIPFKVVDVDYPLQSTSVIDNELLNYTNPADVLFTSSYSTILSRSITFSRGQKFLYVGVGVETGSSTNFVDLQLVVDGVTVNTLTGVSNWGNGVAVKIYFPVVDLSSIVGFGKTVTINIRGKINSIDNPGYTPRLIKDGTTFYRTNHTKEVI